MRRASSIQKLTLILAALTSLVLLSFWVWGDGFTRTWSWEGSISFFETHKGVAGWLGIGLLVSDLVLPIPVTCVVGGLGAVLGPIQGFFYSWVGLVLAGLTGYGLARLGGQRIADRLVSPGDQKRYRLWFDRWGSLAVVASRMLPILPEVFSILAGLYGMHFRRFLIAVAFGSLVPAISYSWLGAHMREHPGPAIWALASITVVAWLIFLRIQGPSESD